jgi:hypothetical protein
MAEAREQVLMLVLVLAGAFLAAAEEITVQLLPGDVSSMSVCSWLTIAMRLIPAGASIFHAPCGDRGQSEATRTSGCTGTHLLEAPHDFVWSQITYCSFPHNTECNSQVPFKES